MAEIHEKSVKLRAEDAVRDGILSIRLYSGGERGKRALVALLGMWAAAGVSVFIPIAHFVLVPGFVLAGPVLAWLRYRQDQALLHTRGVCPRCGEEVTIEMDANERLPSWRYCPQCQAAVQITE